MMTHRRRPAAAPSWTASAASCLTAPSRLFTPSRLAAAVACVTLAGAAVAQVAPRPDIGSVLPGRPVAPQPAVPPPSASSGGVAAADAASGIPLDPPFVSEAAGIHVRPPAGGKLIRRGGGGDEVARFVSDEQKWRFVISRVTLTQGVPLVQRDAAAPTTAPASVDLGAREPGFAETVAAQMPNETPGKLVRSELMPINGYDSAILASRYRESGASFLMQQAVIRRTDKHYYVLSYTTPLGTADDVQKDPAALRALDTFQGILDSVELIDQEQVKRDQDDRLIRTRGMMVNWTPSRLREVIVPEQWLRLIKDGKDIGYSYIVEELANDLPRVGGKSDKVVDPAKALGVRIGVRSRTMPEAGQQVDGESWMWISFDRNSEAFSNVAITRTTPPGADPNAPRPAPKDDPNFDYSVERGTAIRRDRVVPRVVESPGGLGKQIQPQRDEQYDLQIFSRSKRVGRPPMQKVGPPFYLPQALAHLLPRLVPLNQAKSYLFASYVPDQRELMLRYVDVLPPTTVDLGGRVYTAIPIKEKLGLEGSVTTHYLTPDTHRYLGSVNEDNKITIVATDAETLQKIWKDAELQRPGAVDDAATGGTTADEAKPAGEARPAGAKPAEARPAPQPTAPRR